MAIHIINDCHSPSLKDKLKSSLFCFAPHDSTLHHHEKLQPEPDTVSGAGGRRSPYTWLKSQEVELKDKCIGLIGRKGHQRRRNKSADFRYDPESYSLNFEDDSGEKSGEDEFPLSSFMARLPVTPERLTAVAPSSFSRRGVHTWS